MRKRDKLSEVKPIFHRLTRHVWGVDHRQFWSKVFNPGMASANILALGEPLIEMVRLADPIDGCPIYRQSVGGDTLNALVAAARQGGSTGYLSAVGGDPFGKDILALCDHEGINRSTILVRPEDPTGVNFIHPHPEGRRFFYARRGSAASHYSVSDLPQAAIADAKILHVSAVSLAISQEMRQAVFQAAKLAKTAETLVSFDLNLRLNLWALDTARNTIEAFLPLADIVLPSDDEANSLLGPGDPSSHIAHFQRYGARYVLFKRGRRGAVLASPAGRTEISAPQVDAVDSTGAGDSFAGAFLAYLLETGNETEAARRAAIVAAGTVSGYGAIEAIPDRETVLKTVS